MVVLLGTFILCDSWHYLVILKQLDYSSSAEIRQHNTLGFRESWWWRYCTRLPFCIWRVLLAICGDVMLSRLEKYYRKGDSSKEHFTLTWRWRAGRRRASQKSIATTLKQSWQRRRSGTEFDRFKQPLRCYQSVWPSQGLYKTVWRSFLSSWTNFFWIGLRWMFCAFGCQWCRKVHNI